MFVPLGADVVVGLVVPLVTGALAPLAAVPEPLTVAALTVVEPVELTLPEPLLVASTTVEPEALVVVEFGAAVVVEPGVAVVVGLVVALPVTGAVVPLVAAPEPLTVAALTVVEPVAVALPEPLLIALTVLDPIAVVVVVCARAGLPSARPSAPAPTAAAMVVLECGILCIIHLLSGSSKRRVSEKRGGGLKAI